MGEIVVGVDGSDGSQEALQWALAEAGLRGADLRVLCVYQSPANWLGMGEALGSTVGATVSEADLAQYAQETIDEALQGTAVPAGVTVIKDSAEGHAGSALVKASASTDLLVVGSRGHAGIFHDAVLGSVGTYCVHHATCPVVVIPHCRSK